MCFIKFFATSFTNVNFKQKQFSKVVLVSSAVASDSAPAGLRLLPDKSNFVRVVFVLSEAASESALAGQSLFQDKFKSFRFLFVSRAAASDVTSIRAL